MQERNNGADVAAVLRDLVEFLECLNDVELPENLQSTREALLERSRALSNVTAESPEPYLDMNAGKSFQLINSIGNSVEQSPEYVGADQTPAQRCSLQHYYETFQDFHGNGNKDQDNVKTEAEKAMDEVISLYASFSATQAKARSIKSGSVMYLKRERKMFAPFNVFWLNKSSWASLVGSHLLLYVNDRESRPYLVLSLRGYKSRPAPGALARDPKRSEAAFEIYCPGDRTFQFVAKNAQDMREWVDAVTESLEPQCIRNKNRAATFVEILELEATERLCIERVKEEKEKYQDVLNSPKSKTKEKPAITRTPSTPEKIEKAQEAKEEAPPLPARIRRLPSLPSEERIDFEPKDEPYDEEGLYHRIEDVKAQREYQNCHVQTNQKEKKNVTTVDLVQETYDDVETTVDRSKNEGSVETYDDVQLAVKDELISYDDVHTMAENLRAKTEKDKSSKSSKPVQKRSFLDRVRNRKESIKKDDKKPKSPTPSTLPSPPTSPTISTMSTTTTNSTEPELPCYDDVSNFANRDSCASPSKIDEENYLSPPPPRPIYSRPPTIIKCAVPGEDIYDDIGGSCIEMNGNGCKGCANVDVIKDYPKNSSFLSDLQLSIDHEHYQVPKSGIRKVIEHQEELYDDVALSETFKNRQRESPVSEKSIWSRFGSGKRPKIFEHMSRQTSCNESIESTDDNATEQQTKVKPIQKLINKMENTLGKATKVNGVTQN